FGGASFGGGANLKEFHKESLNRFFMFLDSDYWNDKVIGILNADYSEDVGLMPEMTDRINDFIYKKIKIRISAWSYTSKSSEMLLGKTYSKLGPSSFLLASTTCYFNYFTELLPSSIQRISHLTFPLFASMAFFLVMLPNIKIRVPEEKLG